VDVSYKCQAPREAAHPLLRKQEKACFINLKGQPGPCEQMETTPSIFTRKLISTVLTRYQVVG
jgi:hypothetical protein